ncbi:cytochrome c [Halorhodospira halophila]|uniref:Cytochrome c, class II n=1 Tax=Halorhodospira halophila (strain DSM 244 / SL1) TaxID=349124 RepID=A1WU32_HALHL|nr:cytochrome c [Halorhodospira halophila]ABM61194.1 conserved hypothetical protein [Halorhodospira halophila SL1]MBK1729611.1 hypothetical protein [Halorhodospira halophila]
MTHRLPWRSLGIAAIFGLGITAGAAGADDREAIELTEEDRTHCLERMRTYLEVTNEILRATLESDMDAVRSHALAAVPRRYREDDLADAEVPARGTAADGRGQGEGRGGGAGEGGSGRPDRMEAATPEAYQGMMHHQHEAFQEIARDAREVADPAHTQHQLTEVQDTCVACHSAYRFE